MKVTSGKISNYTGQGKKDEKMNQHLLSIDRDLKNLWMIVNYLSPLTGTERSSLNSLSNIGYSYIPLVDNAPVGTPTNYAGHCAVAYCNSNSTFYVYNTSASSFKAIT